MSAAAEGLTEANLNFRQWRKCKRVPSGIPEKDCKETHIDFADIATFCPTMIQRQQKKPVILSKRQRAEGSSHLVDPECQRNGWILRGLLLRMTGFLTGIPLTQSAKWMLYTLN